MMLAAYVRRQEHLARQQALHRGEIPECHLHRFMKGQRGSPLVAATQPVHAVDQ